MKSICGEPVPLALTWSTIYTHATFSKMEHHCSSHSARGPPVYMQSLVCKRILGSSILDLNQSTKLEAFVAWFALLAPIETDRPWIRPLRHTARCLAMEISIIDYIYIQLILWYFYIYILYICNNNTILCKERAKMLRWPSGWLKVNVWLSESQATRKGIWNELFCFNFLQMVGKPGKFRV